MDIQNGRSDRQSNSLTLWSWLRRVLLSPDQGVGDRCGRDPLAVMAAPALVPTSCCDARASGSATAQPAGTTATMQSGVILPFPIHGEALLVKLAEVLRRRVADHGPNSDPLLLQMSRCPRSRLSIDRRAYVEFDEVCFEYRALIEASHETKVILETADFDALVDFVLPYVIARLAGSAAPETAS